MPHSGPRGGSHTWYHRLGLDMGGRKAMGKVRKAVMGGGGRDSATIMGINLHPHSSESEQPRGVD